MNSENSAEIVNFDSSDFNYDYLNIIAVAELTVADNAVGIYFMEKSIETNSIFAYGFVWLKN